MKNYIDNLCSHAQTADTAAIEKAVAALREVCLRRGRIFTMGNGGSAALADHLAADFEKNAYPDGPRPRITSLSAQTAKILAYGNDIAFDGVFAEQLRAQGEAGDLAVMISASGNSPNIVKAVEMAHSLNMTVIGLSGFTGGKLKTMSDIPIHFDCQSYEITEDLHSMVCHMFVVCVRQR
ncbi:MAG: SIS domain-containing protein [Kiritimatiellaeota bacterium]|nr:SIS domain-containing protein [Kiritimatiellota bacterium]